MIARVTVECGRYHDSVRLMQVSREVLDAPGVTAALVAMATDLNLELLAGMGFTLQDATPAGPDDLLIAIAAADEPSLGAAWGVAEAALTARVRDSHAEPDIRSRRVERAARAATLALVSVPGANAFVESMAALRQGLHVMVFSNNVPLDQEIALKQEAAEGGLLVMGPDCGTAIVSGVGLGFANVVRPGPVGIVGASGTGIQQLCCLLDDAGIGVRHALGTGSRDLSEPVGGAATLQGLGALDADASVEVIAIVSKPPHPAVADRVRAAAEASATPTVIAFLGEDGTTLEDAAAEIVTALGGMPQPAGHWPAPRGTPGRASTAVGLFAGGTLCTEAQAIVAAAGVESRFVDLGEDEYTRGRPHPMIDQRLRLEHLAAAAEDRATGVLLIDIVLGFGAHPDPAAELGPVVAAAVGGGVPVVVSLCGTTGDPQDRSRQAAVLNEAGASVWLSNAAAARHAADLAQGGR